MRIREAVRALLLTPDHHVLLVRFEFPAGTRWALPGGGLEPGEGHLDALRRELAEEVGLHDPDIGPAVWHRLHVIPFVNGRYDGQRDHVYLVPTDRFEPRPLLSADELQHEFVFELRWWHVDELTDGLPFVPASLASNLRSLIADGIPTESIDVGV